MLYKLTPQNDTCELTFLPDRKSSIFKEGYFRFDPKSHHGKELIIDVNEGIIEIYLTLPPFTKSKKD